MSNAATRTAIAAAVTGITGQYGTIKGYANRPDVPNALDAWPQWAGGVPRAGAVMNTWNVFVLCPSSTDITADAFADEYGEQLVDALWTGDVLFVESIQPAKIQVGTGDFYGVMITGRSE